jgi:hypothetical protein
MENSDSRTETKMAEASRLQTQDNNLHPPL